MSEGAHALVWAEEPREGRGPSLIATADGTKIGFVSDRGEHAYTSYFLKRYRWQIWEPRAFGEADTLEEGRAAVEAEWARVNEEQPA